MNKDIRESPEEKKEYVKQEFTKICQEYKEDNQKKYKVLMFAKQYNIPDKVVEALFNT
jgi:poly(A) polymerase Pap1